MSEREFLIALCAFVPFGPARIKLLLSYFGSAKKVWNSQGGKLAKLGIRQVRLNAFLQHRAGFDFKAYFKKLDKLSIYVLAHEDARYPENLREIESAPIALYLKGKLRSSDSMAIAIVGSRKMTSYGREVANKFSQELANLGITIISGLARGVDTQAHKGALAVGGRTIAVVGSGLDNIYPPENLRLGDEIVKSGALVSEYPLGYPALPINFAARNRIISGMAKGVLVVEGAAKSGTLLTATHAAEQGRLMFAVPGMITSPLSAAPLALIKNGAKMATSTEDVLEELGVDVRINREALERASPPTPEEEIILNVLQDESFHLDEIARFSSIDVGVVSARLTVMELKGLVKSLGGGIYKKA